MKRCTQCVLPDTYPNIQFDEQGVCNFCSAHKSPVYAGKDALIRQIDRLKSKTGSYEAILGLSGGRDSTFTAHYIVKELGLKVVAFTYDNGMIPDTTWENIHNTVSTLDIDHRVISPQTLQKTVKLVLNGMSYRPSPAMVAFLCTGCYQGITESYAQVVAETDCHLVIKGGGEPEQSFAENLLAGEGPSTRKKLIKGFAREFLRNPSYLNPALLKSFYTEYKMRYAGPKRNYKSIYLFNYVEWDEQRILSTIQEQLKWRVPDKMSSSWRSDCKINVIRQYLYQQLLSFTKNDELLSQLIRVGAITREDALSRLEVENVTNEELLREILTEVEFDPEKLFRAMSRYERNQLPNSSVTHKNHFKPTRL
jgi:tRNA(Ile)-lysidine synthase TilS/MesJ